MDIVRKNTKANNKKKVVVVVIGVLSMILAAYVFLSRSSATHIVDSDIVLMDRVQRGELRVTVRGMGVLSPRDIRWLATNVSGKVEHIHVKPGAEVKKGDIILELSNPELQQRYDESQWELEELESQAQALKVSLESEILDQQSAVIEAQLNYDRSLLTLNAQKKLLKQGVNIISDIDHEEAKIDVTQNKQRWELAQKRLKKQKENIAAQLSANQARVNRMRKTVERVAEQVEQLNIHASINAIIQAMPIELGQQVNSGSNLARLAKRNDFIAELRIPENQIQNVVIGQQVELDTRTSQVAGVVKRIDPSVINGVVQVDVDLVELAPKEARPELTVEGVIEIAQLTDALYVKRPMFAKSFAESFVYLVDETSNTAKKHPVRFGQASTNYIEIESGLQLGQRIIVSDASSWDAHQNIKIN